MKPQTFANDPIKRWLNVTYIYRLDLIYLAAGTIGLPILSAVLFALLSSAVDSEFGAKYAVLVWVSLQILALPIAAVTAISRVHDELSRYARRIAQGMSVETPAFIRRLYQEPKTEYLFFSVGSRIALYADMLAFAAVGALIGGAMAAGEAADGGSIAAVSAGLFFVSRILRGAAARMLIGVLLFALGAGLFSMPVAGLINFAPKVLQSIANPLVFVYLIGSWLGGFTKFVSHPEGRKNETGAIYTWYSAFAFSERAGCVVTGWLSAFAFDKGGYLKTTRGLSLGTTREKFITPLSWAPIETQLVRGRGLDSDAVLARLTQESDGRADRVAAPAAPVAIAQER